MSAIDPCKRHWSRSSRWAEMPSMLRTAGGRRWLDLALTWRAPYAAW